MGLDPIEKKPLYHFKPGKPILSVGNVGCNLRCSFCQNHSISQAPFPQTQTLTARELVTRAKGDPDNIGVAFTYAEPTVWYEYVYDAAAALHAEGLSAVLVTNGFINEEPLRHLLPYIDAMNIDLKGDDRFYRELTGARMEPVKRTIEIAAKQTHVEVTSLIVTGENDTDDFIREAASFLAGVRKNIPYHLSRYFPRYNHDSNATPVKELIRFANIANEYLDYVYVGNADVERSNTMCPQCGKTLVYRDGYATRFGTLSNDGNCTACGYNAADDFIL